MKRAPLARTAPALAAVLFLSALAGCNSKPTTITADDQSDDQKAALNTAKPVTLPPSIQASKTYRCHDNSVVYVDWMSDAKSAAVRTKKGGDATVVSAPAPAAEMTAAGGYSVKGSADAATADIGVPGHPVQSCTA